ncbi:uncharacterized protein N7529_011910 [Penicillium soppii]|uniref:uncharacterized protein n=1 Tax=Penicillium soppii TaxID=69789 RepID=UPI002546B805|nr:uncharacterized protein N7529_011910 [Penicillium soppii]KAJ5852525.1 hypothetical protein N7529_011910 [Penicillium soppii]
MSIPRKTSLDAVSEWRALQVVSIIYTNLLNRQIRRRWLLEHKSMQNKPLAERFRPVIFFEPVPGLRKPPKQINTATIASFHTRISHLRARIEKGKELASEIERRMLQPGIRYPTHFCHTCVEDGERVEVLLTKCGHRVCRTCLWYGVDAGVYECSICLVPAEFVARSPLHPSSPLSPAKTSLEVGFF